MQQQEPLIFVFAIFYLLLLAIYIYAFWRIFKKAGKPGWAAIIPIYNIVILLEIIKKPVWWIVLFFVPIVNIVISIIVAINLAKVFGKSSAYGIVLLWLFAFIGYLMLAFDDSKYMGTLPATPKPSSPPTQSGASSKPATPTPPAQKATPTQTPPKA